MWSRRFLFAGLSTGVIAAALALALIALVLVGVEATGAVGLHLSPLVAFGVPGVIVYPACWYVLVFRRRSYAARDAWALIGLTYVGCCLLVIILFSVWALYQAIDWAVHFAATDVSLALNFLMAPVLFAVYVVIAAALLAVPFVATAGPIALLHRAVLLKWFDRAKPPDGTGQAA